MSPQSNIKLIESAVLLSWWSLILKFPTSLLRKYSVRYLDCKQIVKSRDRETCNCLGRPWVVNEPHNLTRCDALWLNFVFGTCGYSIRQHYIYPPEYRMLLLLLLQAEITQTVWYALSLRSLTATVSCACLLLVVPSVGGRFVVLSSWCKQNQIRSLHGGDISLRGCDN